MKKLLALAAIGILTLPVSARGSQHASGDQDSIRAPFVGAWRLAWLEEPGADGKVHRADCAGLLVYTRDGHMSVQVMYRNAQTSSKSAPVQYAQGGYEASFGRYEVDDGHTFTFHVEGALVRTLVGKDLKRAYELSGNQLIVKSPDPHEHWRVGWERYQDGHDR
jgi:Lipocalin-like domain